MIAICRITIGDVYCDLRNVYFSRCVKISSFGKKRKYNEKRLHCKVTLQVAVRDPTRCSAEVQIFAKKNLKILDIPSTVFDKAVYRGKRSYL